MKTSTLLTMRCSSTELLTRIYIAPNADDLPSWIASMQHIAKEGRCFVISVNQFCKVRQFLLRPFQVSYTDRSNL